MASEKLQEFTDTNFDQSVLRAATPVLVDFWAEWCGPCRLITPTVEALATDFDGRLVVGKLNIDDNPAVPTRFSIRAIPTLLLFKDGQVVEAIVGVAEKEHLRRLIQKHL